MDIDDDVPIDPVLIERFANGNGTVFVGAGISSSSGMPLWSELMAPLKTDLGDGVYDHASNQDIAELYETKYCRSELVRYLKKSLERVSFQLTKTHELIVRLPVKRIYTTNFDDLLEQASSRQGIRRNVISDASQVAFADTSALSIIKLHGDLNHESSLVIGSDDYYSYFTKNPSVSDLLKVELQTHTVLFLGYSFSDVNLGMILGRVAAHSGQVRPLLYSLQLRPKELATRALDRRGVKVIPVDADPNTPEAHQEIERWLRSFKRQLIQHERRRSQTDATVPSANWRVSVPDHQFSILRSNLRRKLDDGIHSDFRVVVVKGEAGIGKTQLVASAVEDSFYSGSVNIAGDAFEKVIWLGSSTQLGAESHTLDGILDAIAHRLDSFLLVGAQKKFSKRHYIDRMLQEHKVLVVIEDLEEKPVVPPPPGEKSEVDKIKAWLQSSGPFARPSSRIVVTSRTLLLPGFVIECERLEPSDRRDMLEELFKQMLLGRTFPSGLNAAVFDTIAAYTFGNPQAMKMMLGLLNGVGQAGVQDALRDLSISIAKKIGLQVDNLDVFWPLTELSPYVVIAIELVFDAILSLSLGTVSGIWVPGQSNWQTEPDWHSRLDLTLRLPDDAAPTEIRVLKAMLVFPQGHPVRADLLEHAFGSGQQAMFMAALRACVTFGLLQHDAQHDEYRLDRITQNLLVQRQLIDSDYRQRLAIYLLDFLEDENVIRRRRDIDAGYWDALVRDEMVKVDPLWPVIAHVMRSTQMPGVTARFVLLLVHYMDSRFLNAERKEFVQQAIAELEQEDPGNAAMLSLLKIDALAWTCMEEEDYAGANKLVSDGLQLNNGQDKSLVAIGRTWQARIASADKNAPVGDAAKFMKDARQALEESAEAKPWITMRLNMIEGDMEMAKRPETALDFYQKAEQLTHRYGGEGDGYPTGPRIGLALLKMWDVATTELAKLERDQKGQTDFNKSRRAIEDKRASYLREAEHLFRKLELNQHVPAARLYGKYGLALVAAKRHSTREVIVKLQLVHQEILSRHKGNVLLKLAESLYQETIKDGGTAVME